MPHQGTCSAPLCPKGPLAALTFASQPHPRRGLREALGQALRSQAREQFRRRRRVSAGPAFPQSTGDGSQGPWGLRPPGFSLGPQACAPSLHQLPPEASRSPAAATPHGHTNRLGFICLCVFCFRRTTGECRKGRDRAWQSPLCPRRPACAKRSTGPGGKLTRTAPPPALQFPGCPLAQCYLPTWCPHASRLR